MNNSFERKQTTGERTATGSWMSEDLVPFSLTYMVFKKRYNTNMSMQSCKHLQFWSCNLKVRNFHKKMWAGIQIELISIQHNHYHVGEILDEKELPSLLKRTEKLHAQVLPNAH